MVSLQTSLVSGSQMDAGEVVLRQFRTRQARGCMTPLTLAIEKFVVGKLSGKSMQQVNFLGDDSS